ncbi:MAG: site-specific DNA-methyltransferase [Prevotella sp.]|nr:site-specific DNA-methyltransferase [Prevotella sp.]
MATNYYESFIKKLQEIFMMDHAELDFGIYRIMNQKRADINHFLKFELLPQVKTALADASDGSENEVFSHLVTFFSRYYDNGDFISKRRYKDNTYAIPYNGEEVKLHWANADQYYIKSSEYFRDYSFVLPTSRRKVHFVLKDASTEQNNNKTANNMERRFALYKPEAEGESFYEVNGDELNIFFTYELMPKGTKQNDLMAEALDNVKDIIPLEFSELLTVKSPTDKNANRTLFEKHLTDYTAKNSFDYFIHKDLGGFLRRELDFYIKNEVMLLDDLDVKHIESQLNIIKAIKLVGEKIIRMLAQLEDFQKKLWLKKKFVVQSDYCITLDRVPRKLYPEILANERQREEWVRLFAIDEIKGDLTTEAYSVPLTMEFLEQNPFLVLDTAFFSKQFKHKLMASMENVDRDCNGLLINSDNYQALELLRNKYNQAINCVYIDPPYNAKSSEILYKNSYKDSSWNSFIHNRALITRELMSNDAIFQFAIDDYEVHNSILLLNDVFGKENHIGNITVIHNPRGRNDDKFYGTAHEYMLSYAKNIDLAEIGLFPLTEEDAAQYRNADGLSNYSIVSYMRTGNNSKRFERPNLFYPIYVNPNTLELSLDYQDNWIELLPIVADDERTWRWGKDTFLSKKDTEIVCKKDFGGYNGYKLFKKRRNIGIGKKAKTVWMDSKYDASTHGIMYLRKLFGDNDLFSYPKSINTVFDALQISSKPGDIVLDYFGGSATTADAVIKLNRLETDEEERRFIIAEMGNYFNSITRPRIEKVIYSPDWKDGKPVSRQGISQCFKYMRLEQYEDTLNNLKIKEQQTAAQFNEGSGFKESYMLEYMLDVETRDSLLNLNMFENPFAMTLKTTKDNELVETEVDMVETFNYLIGLNVETEDWYRDENICVVQGHTHRDNLHTLVIWRNCKEIDNEQLNQFFERMDFRTRDSEFDLIYVNGDNLLPNLRRDEDNWKVVLIEEEFTKRMFETE